MTRFRHQPRVSLVNATILWGLLFCAGAWMEPLSAQTLVTVGVKNENDQLRITFEDGEGAFLTYALEESAGLSPAGWTKNSSAVLSKLGTHRYSFSVPMNSAAATFFRVGGGLRVTGSSLRQEAEDAVLTGSFVVVDDATASGGRAVEAVSGPTELNYAEFHFVVPTAGYYVLRTMIRAIDGNHDSMFVSIDGAVATQYLWDTARGGTYVEDYVNHRGGADPLTLFLGEGIHVVRFGHRESLFLDLVHLEFARFVDGGTYQIVNAGSGLALETNGRSVRQGVNEFLETQQWTLTGVANDIHAIRVKENGESLDHYNPGNVIGTWTYSASKTNQQWRLIQVEEGLFTISALDSPASMVISPGSFSDADEAGVIQTTYVGDAHQHWALKIPGQPVPKAHTVYLIGDSTVSNWSSGYYPKTGWGQVLNHFFDSEVDIKNRAISGTSSKSFYDSFWAPIRAQLQPGNFVFIQFGINDSNSDPNRRTEPFGSFQGYLTSFVNETKAAGAHPVLVATLRRNAWNGTSPDTLYDAYHDYPVATRQLSGTLGVPLIDLDQATVPLLEGLGPGYTGPFLYMHLLPGEYPNYSSGQADNVHFQEMGALEMARLVIDGIKALAGDPHVSGLIGWIQPDHEVAVFSNNVSYGLVTRTARYSAGTPVTLKARPNSGYKFLRWETSGGNVVSTSALFHFEMGTTDLSYMAVFGAL